MKPRACFLTGTDTGIGKTWVTLGLMSALRAKGQKVVGMKPVASGCRQTKAGLRNEDAESICQASTPAVSYDLVNPYAFEEPVAPHAAAEKAGRDPKSIGIESITGLSSAMTRPAVGTMDQAVAMSQLWMDAGATHYCFGSSMIGLDNDIDAHLKLAKEYKERMDAL